MSTLKIGDQVVVKAEFSKPSITGIWTIARKLTKNFEMRRPNDIAGTGPRLRAKPEQLELAHGEPTQATATIVPTYDLLDVGNVVLVDDPTGKIGGDFYIVIKDNTYKNNRVQIVKLGGEGGKYWNVPRGWVTKIDPEL